MRCLGAFWNSAAGSHITQLGDFTTRENYIVLFTIHLFISPCIQIWCKLYQYRNTNKWAIKNGNYSLPYLYTAYIETAIKFK